MPSPATHWNKILFFSNKSSQKKLSLPTSPIQLNNINENQIKQGKGYFQFENQKLTNKSDFYSNSDQEFENLLENQHEFSYGSLLSHELFSQDEVNKILGTEDGEDSEEENTLLDESNHAAKKQSALDALITKIGMGKFQKQLLVLCGFGWLADNVSDEINYIIINHIFVRMMFGALFWGVLSDSHGRKQAFNWTLAITSLFGVFSSFSQNFAQLCFLLFLLGFGVGGNMPVDGALFLEFIPKEHQYLLTFMSVFFSFGAVLTSVLAYIVLPPYSCPEMKKGEIDTCDVSIENNGWRYLLATLGTLTFLMLVARILFFRLQESPKYLISRNRKHDAILVLRKIASINGNDMQIQVTDFPITPVASNKASMDGSISPSSFSYPTRQQHHDDDPESFSKFFSNPLGFINSRLSSKVVAVKPLFSRKWVTTTLLVWAIWTLVSFGYTMFNVFLPKYLENLGSDDEDTDDENRSMKNVLKDYLIYSICGIPGSLLGTYFIETALGRRGTMSLATFGTAFAVFMFSIVNTHSGEVIFSAMFSLLATLNYAVIYGYTPEVFEAKLRGTACGISSAFGRIAGVIAPIITGILLSIGITIPLYVSSFLFLLSGICMVLLPIETRGRQA
ncbi:1002_t:CDS:2 [Entrophospora sp. SA101]|nr:1002_t:CDS:2 [Entrophospora sp. SA101]